MSIAVTPCRSPEEMLSSLTPIFHYFGRSPAPQDASRFAPFVEPSRAFVVREHDGVVAGCASFPLEMTVGGGRVARVSGLTVVGVLPTHRRRGILRAMMRAHLDDTRRRGEAVASLWASEDTIYGRFGYGIASLTGDIDVPRTATAFARAAESRGTFRIFGEAEAVEPMTEAYERIRPLHAGMLARSADWWRNRRLADPENRRQGGGELNRVVGYHDGRPSSLAFYRVNQHFEAGQLKGHVAVVEALAATPEATRDLWQFLFDIDLVERVKAILLPLDHPLLLLLAKPRELNFGVHDGLWIRLVDLPAALAARPLGSSEPVVIEVADAFCSWNEGRWRVSGSGAERTQAEPDLACDVTALGSVYLGGFSFTRLAQAGRVTALKPDAAARADALFPSSGAPWCPEIF